MFNSYILIASYCSDTVFNYGMSYISKIDTWTQCILKTKLEQLRFHWLPAHGMASQSWRFMLPRAPNPGDATGEPDVQDWKTTDEVAGVENDGLPIDGRDRRSG